MRLALSVLLTILPLAAPAVGDDDYFPPTMTETTEECEDGTIWDEETERCVAPSEATQDDASLMRAVRELAYAGRYDDADAVLDHLDPADPWVLTYRGFLARKRGAFDVAVQLYQAALDRDPNNLLTRSYLGQGYVEKGAIDAARDQLTEIRRRGGRGTWPELALRLAIESGSGFNY